MCFLRRLILIKTVGFVEVSEYSASVNCEHVFSLSGDRDQVVFHFAPFCCPNLLLVGVHLGNLNLF